MADAIIHLGQSLPAGSSGLPENAAFQHPDGPPGRVSLFGLAPRGVYLADDVATDAGELLPHPFTHYRTKTAGILSVALVVTSYEVPGRYPARCPSVFRLSSFHC